MTDETVMIEHFCLVSAPVGQVQLCLLRVKVHARLFAHHFGVDRLVRLHAHYQLIPLALRIKDVTWHISELQSHLGLALVQGFPTAQDKGNPCCREKRTRETKTSMIYSLFIRTALR